MLVFMASSRTSISAVTWAFPTSPWTRAQRSKRKLSAPSWPCRRRDRGRIASRPYARNSHRALSRQCGLPSHRGADVRKHGRQCRATSDCRDRRQQHPWWYVGNQGAYPAQLQALLRSAIAFLMMVPKGARVSASNHDDASLFPPAPRHAGDVPHLGVSLLFGGLKFAASTPKRTLARGT